MGANGDHGRDGLNGAGNVRHSLPPLCNCSGPAGVFQRKATAGFPPGEVWSTSRVGHTSDGIRSMTPFSPYSSGLQSTYAVMQQLFAEKNTDSPVGTLWPEHGEVHQLLPCRLYVRVGKNWCIRSAWWFFGPIVTTRIRGDDIRPQAFLPGNVHQRNKDLHSFYRIGDRCSTWVEYCSTTVASPSVADMGIPHYKQAICS